MLDAFIDLAKSKIQAWSSNLLRDNYAVQYLIGDSDTAWKAARAGVDLALDNVWDQVQAAGVLSLNDKTRIRKATNYAIHISHDMCHHVLHQGERDGHFQSPAFERRVWDVNSVFQQTQWRRTPFETVRTYPLGGASDCRWL